MTAAHHSARWPHPRALRSAVWQVSEDVLLQTAHYMFPLGKGAPRAMPKDGDAAPLIHALLFHALLIHALLIHALLDSTVAWAHDRSPASGIAGGGGDQHPGGSGDGLQLPGP